MKIISIDGGGMKGFIPCSVLIALEKLAGKPCSQLADMFAGTSIGGILACLLANGKSATEALEFFTADGPKIFGSQQWFGWGSLLRSRYAAGPLEDCLRARLGDARLATTPKALLVPAFDLASYDPVFFKSREPDMAKDYALWEVARATSAAQTYFPAFALDNMVCWDGGNVVNNPALCAVAEALTLWPGEPLHVLSLGCGAAASKTTPASLINAGLLKIGLATMDVLFDTNDELPDYVLRRVMTHGYRRVSPVLTRDLAIDGAAPTDLQALRLAADTCVAASLSTLSAFLAGE